MAIAAALTEGQGLPTFGRPSFRAQARERPISRIGRAALKRVASASTVQASTLAIRAPAATSCQLVVYKQDDSMSIALDGRNDAETLPPASLVLLGGPCERTGRRGSYGTRLKIC
jgi:hypothetical protein